MKATIVVWVFWKVDQLCFSICSWVAINSARFSPLMYSAGINWRFRLGSLVFSLHRNKSRFRRTTLAWACTTWSLLLARSGQPQQENGRQMAGGVLGGSYALSHEAPVACLWPQHPEDGSRNSSGPHDPSIHWRYCCLLEPEKWHRTFLVTFIMLPLSFSRFPVQGFLSPSWWLFWVTFLFRNPAFMRVYLDVFWGQRPC
jgi:hypothetical protein